jgi:hypothetical protein
MPTDTSLHALRDASPRNQPGFDEWIASFDSLRTQIPATPLHAQRPLPKPDARRRRVVGLAATAAAAVAAVGVVLGLALTAASPPSADAAAAQRALAATAAAPSGTMTTTMLHAGVTRTIDAARWNGNDIAFTPGDPPIIRQLLLIGGGMYVQTSEGAWWHYASASNVGPKPLGGLEQLAQDNIASTTPQQILALATNVQKTTQSDGTTVYTGTIPQSSLDPATLTGNSAITSMILGAQKRTNLMFGGGQANIQNDLQLQMSVGSDGLVKQVSVTFQQDGTYTWSVTYSQLGTTPPITPPASSTDEPPGSVPPGVLPPGTPSQNTQPQNTQPAPITPADRLDYLNAASCIRSHGFPDFPDPTFANNTVTFNIPPNIDTSSTQARQAEAICVKLIPPGLPYSSRNAP